MTVPARGFSMVAEGCAHLASKMASNCVVCGRSAYSFNFNLVRFSD